MSLGALPRRRASRRGAPAGKRSASKWQSALLVGGLALASSGCAGHAAKTLAARDALDVGAPEQALDIYNKKLKVKSAEDVPDKMGGDKTLLILDRSMVLQELEQYPLSSRDLQLADKEIEMLDLQKTAMADVGKYLFSDDSGPYQAPPYEKLLINTMNMVNYLARHDLNGAKIEARRFSIISKYLAENEHSSATMTAAGAYLAGFAFEKSGRPDIALRYYDEALAVGVFKSLVEPIQRITGGTTSHFENIKKLQEAHPVEASADESASAEGNPAAGSEASAGDSPAADSPASGNSPAADSPATPDSPAAEAESKAPATDAPAFPLPEDDPNAPGELLVVINYGRVPAKVAKRIPIGLALTFATLYLSSSMTSQANELAAQGLVTWINYPDLEETQRVYKTPGAKVDGKWATLEGALAVDVEARRAYEADKGKILASAITRMVTRILAGQAAKAAASDDTVGLLLSLGTQAALTAADTPDTRSWSTLPGRIAVTRVMLPPGQHTIEVQAQGARKSITVDMEPGSWEAIALTVLR